MRKIILLLIWVGIINYSYSQSTTNITFTAEYNFSSYQLDSIVVENQTNGSDTILYYPDTVLTLTLRGSYSSNHYEDDELSIQQNFPNPFSDYTTVHIYMPESDYLTIQLIDISGRVVSSYGAATVKGQHQFKIDGCETNNYILTALTSKSRNSVNLQSINSNGSRCRIDYIGQCKQIIRSKSVT